MGSFYRALAEYEPLIYIILTIGGLFILRRMYLNWREWRDAVYRLEREFALQRLTRTVVLTVGILLLFLFEFYVATFVAPSLPASDLLATPTLNLLATPIGTVPPGATLDLTAQPVQSGMSGCVPDRIMLTSPKPGEVIGGTVTLTGTASIPNFGFYKYEVAPVGTNNWVTISAGAEPVRDNELGKWDTTALANGDYFLQLVVIDNVGQTQEPCVIAVRILNQ
ncbi:MAG TPA: hypothetical protein VNK49_11650 [Anaerolineales bacterium]|nr:hypothetical protein [Anaerolineales bacterium]